MRNDLTISRRAILAAAGALPLAFSLPGPLRAETLPLVTVTKDPSCGCCDGWVAHIEAAGFPVRVIESDDVFSLKQRLGVPADLASCHTAEVDGYVIEGHVPAVALRRLLAERPQAIGLAVPGMPAGSPGMDFPGVEPELYDVLLFDASGRRAFLRFNGAQEI
ncbi:MAG TPA: DUF411 domain-containing protein [Amaricoccus sp.]|jgi:hypothetical protein|uniref:DUF411 domain-containing protein n=1 Tax=Amaricoccus sp. TaxID=1872485 RepID=UPI002CC5B11C|nr:DUF411 domain-containing protein [Amaricoccus sp.]HMQ94419.1 DUF411 domain-containing protein [Amaricoccus sp.]HMR36552.1 DUF411 domain-containing protein [Paracoccus sp. (in: a-proteobacteria)]HMR53457.1 DUF411 domain-containing protein [Amaricoccus sp.]HMU00416.1 DUF411 domain-containing protein [Amaricoccus sp.]